MKTSKGLTIKDHNFINSTCRSIFKFEKHGVNDSELRHQIYMLGLYNYRKFHKVGISKDFKNPRILEESLKDGDFYSALQMYKTLLSRTSPKEVKNARHIAEEGTIKLLEFGYSKAATELGKQFITDYLIEFKIPMVKP